MSKAHESSPSSEFLERLRATKPVSSKRLAMPALQEFIISIQPATMFIFKFKSSAGVKRVFQLEYIGLESIGSPVPPFEFFRAGGDSAENTTEAGFVTSSESIPMAAQAHILVDGGLSGDSIVCRSLGSFEGLSVTLTIDRVEIAGSPTRLLKKEIHDDSEHTFLIS